MYFEACIVSIFTSEDGCLLGDVIHKQLLLVLDEALS